MTEERNNLKCREMKSKFKKREKGCGSIIFEEGKKKKKLRKMAECFGLNKTQVRTIKPQLAINLLAPEFYI
jgi:hypothetical protein